MTFFARPDLSNLQFKQLSGSVLTLSGQTQIASVSGFTLTDGVGGFVPIIATGGTNNSILTYLNGKIMLVDTTGGTGIYVGSSPTTCTIGGLTSGSTIFGCSVSCILQDMLVPILYPTLTDPSNDFTISPTDVLYEVGTCICLTGTSTFDRGCINPSYSTSGYRSGSVNTYEYNEWGNSVCESSICPLNVHVITPYQITYGNNNVSSGVCYDVGEQPLDSCGNNYCSPYSSGTTDFINYCITGIYPYYYGTYSSGGVGMGVNRPTPTALLITGGTKVVDLSSGSICINYNSTNDDYIWFAIPQASTSKLIWYVCVLNNGDIGGSVSIGGNLFPDPDIISSVANDCWNSQTYKLYISNYQTAVSTIMELRNS